MADCVTKLSEWDRMIIWNLISFGYQQQLYLHVPPRYRHKFTDPELLQYIARQKERMHVRWWTDILERAQDEGLAALQGRNM